MYNNFIGQLVTKCFLNVLFLSYNNFVLNHDNIYMDICGTGKLEE